MALNYVLCAVQTEFLYTI